MKRIICWIITVLLLINAMAFAASAANADRDIVIEVSGVTVCRIDAGSTITVPVEITDNPGFGSATLKITYDPSILQFTSISLGAVCSSGFMIMPNITENDNKIILWGLYDTASTGNFLNLTFKVLKEGTSEVSVNILDMFNGSSQEISATVVPGDVIVGHDWKDATCTDPKTCASCGVTEGDAVGHDWKDATCADPKTCNVCGAFDGKALGHTEGEAVKENETPATDNAPGSYDEVVYCTVCGEEISRKTVTVDQLDGVAKVGETSYDVLADALAAAQAHETKTAVLLTDVEEEILMIPAGVTLDLNGKTITASVAVLAYGDIVDTAAEVGGIKIGTDKIVYLQANNTYMPLYDTTTGCYKFFDYEIEALTKNGTADSINFGVRVLFDNREAYKVLAQGATNMSITLSLTWDGRSASPVQYTITEDTVKGYATKAFDQSETGSVTTAISVNVSGLKSIEGKTLSATAKFTSTTNVASAVPFDAYVVPSTNGGTETK